MRTARKTFLETLDRSAFIIAMPAAIPAERCRLASSREHLPQKMALVQFEAAKFYAVPLEDLIGRRRGPQPVSWARQVAVSLILELTGATTMECMAVFSGREHSAASHSRQVVREQVDAYPAIKADLDRLRARLLGLPEFHNSK